MAGGQREEPSPRAERRAFRGLAKAGCGPKELHLIVSHLGKEYPTEDEREHRLSEVAEFATAIGAPAAQDYFRAIGETAAVGELTDPRVLEFARSVDRHTAEWYFWAIWGTRAVRELTSETVLRAVEFFRAIDSPATVEFFLAIRETKAVTELTDPRVLDFVRAIGSDAATEFFGSCWETKAVAQLTGAKVLDFARAMGGDAAQEYFRAIRETKAVSELTDGKVLAFASSLGSRGAREYFRTIHETKAATKLTDENVLLFAEVIGKGPARAYFRAIGSTKAVAELTSEHVLRTSGVIRSIGPDAALDYFLAIAATNVVPSAPAGTEGGTPAAAATTVPVLTLLDLPNYGRYRSAGLLGTSAVFWWGAWRLGSLSPGASLGLVELSLTIAAWVGLLCGLYLLLGSIADRSSQEFLRRRRRLLNEHGIRWHDCLATEQRCELCWSASHTHEDRRFDYERFCRCPAC